MFRFDIDITPVINGKERHLEGYCEIISSNSFKVTMTMPFNGLSITKHFENNGEMDMDATFANVEKDLQELYKQGIERIEQT